MSRTFLLAGSIVDNDVQRETFEDVTPVQINSFLNGLEPGEDFTMEITSYGGSVPAGIAICNLIKKASAEGHRSTAHVIGIAASMASGIACACDELKMDANALMMIHAPWTITMGNADDMRKEADTLDTMRDALLAVYRTKFDVSDEVLKKMIADETWILGSDAEMFGLKAEVIPTDEPLKIAASNKLLKFMNVPKSLKEMIMDKEEEIKGAEKPVEDKTEETPKADEQVRAPAAEYVTKEEADKRVSGMQSAMAKQMDAMKKDYEAKIADFEVQIKAKDEELTNAKAEVTSLGERLAKTEKELSEMTSAFEDKKNALEALNAGVNTPNAVSSKPWKDLHGDALLEWCRTNR